MSSNFFMRIAENIVPRLHDCIIILLAPTNSKDNEIEQKCTAIDRQACPKLPSGDRLRDHLHQMRRRAAADNRGRPAPSGGRPLPLRTINPVLTNVTVCRAVGAANRQVRALHACQASKNESGLMVRANQFGARAGGDSRYAPPSAH